MKKRVKVVPDSELEDLAFALIQERNDLQAVAVELRAIMRGTIRYLASTGEVNNIALAATLARELQGMDRRHRH